MALRAARDRERAAGLDPAALVIGVVHLRGIGEDAGLLVEDEGVVVPAVPEREAGLEHLVGPVVAQLARRQLVEARVARLQIGGRGHHVPGHAALAHHVERGEPPRQVIGRVEAGGERGPQPEMAGRRRHHRQHDGRIEEGDLPAAPHIGVVAVAMDVVEAEQVGEEAAVELRRFELARDQLVAAGLQDVVQRGLGMTPTPGVLRRRAGLQIGDQMHLASGHDAIMTRGPGRLQHLSCVYERWPGGFFRVSGPSSCRHASRRRT